MAGGVRMGEEVYEFPESMREYASYELKRVDSDYFTDD